MDFKKYWPIILIIALVAIYFAFKTSIDKWLGMAKGLSSPSWASCGKTFFAKLPDGKILSITTTDEGTTGHPIAAYYKNEVELNQDGVSKSGNPIKITKEEFDGMCKYMYNPPYAWYTEKPQTSTGEGHGRKMAMGGIVGMIGMSPSFGGGIGATSVALNNPYQPIASIYDVNGNLMNPSSNFKQKACCRECLDPLLDKNGVQQKGPNGTALYTCAKNCGCASF